MRKAPKSKGKAASAATATAAQEKREETRLKQETPREETLPPREQSPPPPPPPPREETPEKPREPWEIEDPVWTEFSQEYYEGARVPLLAFRSFD